MNKTIAILLMAILSLAIVVYAQTLTYNQPTAYATVTSTSVNFSASFTQVSGGGTAFNVTIYNSSTGSTGPFDILYDGPHLINGTFWNETITLVDGSRHWLYFNITNGTSDGKPVISATRVIDVDTDFLKFQLGVYDSINFSLSDGNLNLAGTIVAGGAITAGGDTTVESLITDEATGAITTCTANELRGNATGTEICLCTSTNNWLCATVS